jgi:hypothetical protein
VRARGSRHSSAVVWRCLVRVRILALHSAATASIAPSPSGKAPDSDSGIRWFESIRGCQSKTLSAVYSPLRRIQTSPPLGGFCFLAIRRLRAAHWQFWLPIACLWRPWNSVLVAPWNSGVCPCRRSLAGGYGWVPRERIHPGVRRAYEPKNLQQGRFFSSPLSNRNHILGVRLSAYHFLQVPAIDCTGYCRGVGRESSDLLCDQGWRHGQGKCAVGRHVIDVPVTY